MLKYVFILVMAVSIASAQPASVTPLGPDGGIISILKGSLTDDVILAVVRENDLYRSIDGGESWMPVPPLVSELDKSGFIISDITFFPNSSDTVLLASTKGLYRSIDKGISWSLIPAFPTPRFSIRYAPGNQNILIGSDENGVLRSTDKGNTWMPLKDNIFFGNRMVRRVAIHPGDKNPATMRIVATTGFDDTTGVFLTTNGGATWSPLITGLPSGPGRKIYAAEVDSTGLGNTDFRVIIGTGDGIYVMQTDYASGAWQALQRNDIMLHGIVTGGMVVYQQFDTLTQTHNFNLFISSNGSDYNGAPAATTPSNGILKIESRFNTIFPVIPTSPPPVTRIFDKLCDVTSMFVPIRANKQKMYVGTTNGIFVTTDGGGNWNRKNSGIQSTAIRNVVSFSANTAFAHILFAGVYGGGIIRSTDDGVSWQEANDGLLNPYVTTVAVNKKRNTIYAGTPLTIFRSIDAGATWNSIFSVQPANVVTPALFRTDRNDMTIRISPVDPDIILFRSPAYGINISTDGGMQWSVVVPPPGFDTVYVPENIAFDPMDPSTIYLSGIGMFKSTDLGKQWIDVSSNLPLSAADGAAGPMIPLSYISPTINPMNNNEIYVAAVFSRKDNSPNRSYRTTDGGASWSMLDTVLKSYDFEFDRYDPQRVISSGVGGIFRTVNGGFDWTPVLPPQKESEIFLIDPHDRNANIYYAGSSYGALKVTLNDLPLLSVDTTEIDFGTVRVGEAQSKTVTFRNTNGARNVLVSYIGMSYPDQFYFTGDPVFDIPAGGEQPIELVYVPTSGGASAATVLFTTTDLQRDTVRLRLTGRAFTREVFENFSFDFGTVTVGADSALFIDIDNQFGTAPITVNFLGSTDSTEFIYSENRTVTVDTGSVTPLKFTFAPRSAGVKKSFAAFTTTDPKFPAIQLRLTGTGVIKNFISRRVLIDTGVGFLSMTNEPIVHYYSFLTKLLRRADMAVDWKKAASSSQYNSMLFVRPSGQIPQEMIDSLRGYIINGGTVVAVGDFGPENNLPFNTFFHDSVWQQYGVRTGIRFNADLIVDGSPQDKMNYGTVTAFPYSRNTLTNNVDSIIAFASGSLSVDSTVTNAAPLFVTHSPAIVSIDPVDSTVHQISTAIVAAVSRIGKGKIVALADAEIWWDGFVLDSIPEFGILSGKNLQFALNVFGAIDDYSVQLPEPTPQEEYKLISIPYSFRDSSVLALFKDLGQPNDLVWRMFGKWSDATGYAEFPKDFKTIRRGEGYWLITKQPTNINFGSTDVQGSESDFEIMLNPGYNLIGNPFPYAVSWAESEREDSTVSRILWKYNRGFDTTTQTMEPFRGYFLKNNSKQNKNIRINSNRIVSTAALPKENDPYGSGEPGEWKVQLIAENASGSDRMNYIGMIHAEQNDAQRFNIEEPPAAPGDFVSLSLINGISRYAADYRPIVPSGQFWDFEVTSNQHSLPITISTKIFGEFPQIFTVYLLDIVKERMYDISLSQSHSFTFDKNEGKRSFRILVGDRNFVSANANGIPLVPLEYSLSQNFPNPFNPITTIQYTLSNSGFVKLDVFNMLGQKIKSLVQAQQPIGSYTVQWDATNDSKIPVASGIYYYRLQAGNFSSSKKMTLIK